jgi:hypothetical protein
MDKERLFINVKIIKNKKFELWTKDDIDNLLIIYKYKDCYQYYDIILSVLKKYIDWRKVNNISYNYSLINLIDVYLLITESLIINNYVNYYEIYDILHTKSLCDIFCGLSSDTLLMIVVILFMIFRICYYIKILTDSTITKSTIKHSRLQNNDNIFYGDNNPNVDIFGLNLNINEDLQENEEINTNKFDIKNIFKDFNLQDFNLQNFNLQDFNLEKFDLSSLMKKFEDKLKSNNDNKTDNKTDNKNNNLKCKCHLCNNCLNKKII